VMDFAAMLKSLAAQAPPAATETAEGRSGEFAAQRDALEPQLLEAQRIDREKATKLGAVWDYANEQAAAGNYDNALKAFSRLKTAIAGVLAAAPTTDAARHGIPENIVEERKKFLTSRWQQVVSDVSLEVDKLAPVMTDVLPDSVAKELLDGVQKGLAEFYDELNDAIFKTNSASEGDMSSVDQAVQVIRSYLGRIPKEPRIQCFKNAKSAVGVQVDLEGMLVGALTELETRLTS